MVREQQVVVAQVEDGVAAGGDHRVVAVALAVVGSLGEVEEADPLVARDQLRPRTSRTSSVTPSPMTITSRSATVWRSDGVDGERERGRLVVCRDQHRGPHVHGTAPARPGRARRRARRSSSVRPEPVAYRTSPGGSSTPVARVGSAAGSLRRAVPRITSAAPAHEHDELAAGRLHARPASLPRPGRRPRTLVAPVEAARRSNSTGTSVPRGSTKLRERGQLLTMVVDPFGQRLADLVDLGVGHLGEAGQGEDPVARATPPAGVERASTPGPASRSPATGSARRS